MWGVVAASCGALLTGVLSDNAARDSSAIGVLRRRGVGAGAVQHHSYVVAPAFRSEGKWMCVGLARHTTQPMLKTLPA